MKRILIPVLIIFPFILIAATLHISQLPPELAQYTQPDVMGMVSIDDDQIPDNISDPPRTPPQVWDGWPVTRTGATTEGGILVDVNGDGQLEVVQNVGAYCCVYDNSGAMMTGWPQSMSYQPYGAPAWGDIDGDGAGEIVVGARQVGTGNAGLVYAWEADGSAITGFPVNPGGGPTRSVSLADVDSDGDLEILVGARDYPDAYIFVYQGDGSVMQGWPQSMDHVPASSVACGDITGDGVPEIFCESYLSLWAWDTSGNTLDGWPYSPGTDRVFSYSSPVLADIDGDGLREVIVGDHSSATGDGQVHCLNADGSVVDGWPQSLGNWIYGPVAVGDIDGDGALDLAAGDQVMSGSPACHVKAWSADGSLLTGWPVGPVWSINTQCIIADLDGDGEVELMWDDNTTANEYQGYNHDGTAMADWPLSTGGGMSFFITPCVADVDADGDLDMLGGGTEPNTAATELYLWSTGASWDASLAHSPMHLYNPRHDGVYGVGETPPPPVYGDVNDDDEVTDADAELVLQYAAGQDPLPEIDPRPWEAGRLLLADVDGDSEIHAFDAYLVGQFVEGVIDSFPVQMVNWEPPEGSMTAVWNDDTYHIEFFTDMSLYAFDVVCDSLYPMEDHMHDPEWVNATGDLEFLDDSNSIWAASGVPNEAVSSGVFLQAAVDTPIQRNQVLHFSGFANTTPVEFSVTVLWHGVDDNDIPALATLSCAPNPFNPSATVAFSLPQPGEATLAVYNLRGQRVRTLACGKIDAGDHTVVWNGDDEHGAPVSSGVYLLRLEAGEIVITRKAALLK